MFTRRTMLREHLRYNHVPAIPHDEAWLDFFEAAIDAVSDGWEAPLWEAEVTAPNGVTTTVAHVIEAAHLDGFLPIDDIDDYDPNDDPFSDDR